MRSEGDDMSGPEEVPQAREDLDIPFGPPPEEYLYRCPVCGTELLVNEAIIDVGIGMAKFQNEYYPGYYHVSPAAVLASRSPEHHALQANYCS